MSQKHGLQIMLAIKKRLKLTPNPFLKEAELSYSICTTSTRGIQNVIDFLRHTPAKFKGYKRAQYLKWLHEVRVNVKYMNVNVPMKY